MWFKTKTADHPLGSQQIVWDNKTQDFIAKRNGLEIHVTSVIRHQTFDLENHDSPTPDQHRCDYDIRGVITFPKIIPVEIRFGGANLVSRWSYNIIFGSSDTDADLPAITINVADPNGTKQNSIYLAHKAALISGRRSSVVHFTKQEGDGYISEKDNARQYFSDFPVLGMHIRDELQAASLPNWAAPYDVDRFSLNEAPAPRLVSYI